MRPLLVSVVWRYIAIAGQFVVVLLVARQSPLEVAGQYFSIFGLVTVAYLAVGFGAPDGLVKLLPAVPSDDRRARSTLVRACLWCSLATGLFLCSMAVPLVVGVFGFSIADAALTAVWAFLYAMVFALAQSLIATGAVAWGSFTAYSSANIGYLVTLVPYLLVSEQVSLEGLLLAATAGVALAVVLAVAVLSVSTRASKANPRPPGQSHETLRAAISKLTLQGMPIAITRMLQASLPWIPTWILSASGALDQAAIYAAASRLVVVVTSILAALRFAARPSIVEMSTRGESRAIERLSRRTSALSAVPTVLGLVLLSTAGTTIVPAILGADYLASVPVLIVLMFGVLAEAFGGLSDEILKMTGHAWVVLTTLMAAVALQAIASSAVAGGGASALAYVTVAAFALQYGAQVIWLRMRTPISIWPRILGRNPAHRREEPA